MNEQLNHTQAQEPTMKLPHPVEAQKNLWRSSMPLTTDQKKAAVLRIAELTDSLTRTILWKAVKDAHAYYHISAADFSRNLFITKGLRYPLCETSLGWDDYADPYEQLDLKVWASYLLYGGGRIVSQDGAPRVLYATDQDVFFRFFRVNDARFNPALHRLESKLSQHLKTVLDMHNTLFSNDWERVDLKSMMNLMNALLQCIKALQNKNWALSNRVSEQKNKFVQDYFRALGEVTYSVPAIMTMINACAAVADPTQPPSESSYMSHRIPENAQDDVEKMLMQAGLTVSDGMVTYWSDVLKLACHLQHAWVETSNSSWDAGVEYLHSRLPRQIKQDPAPDQGRTPLTEVRKQQTFPALAQEKLWESGIPLTEDQKREAVLKITKLTDELTRTLLWRAVKDAHTAYHISDAVFAQNLFVTRGIKKPVWDKSFGWNDYADPYAQLDLKAWTRYLLYGGGRIVSPQEAPYIVYATDQDAFFRFFNIKDAVYNGISHKLEGKLSEPLKVILDMRDFMFHKDWDQIDLKSLMHFMNALIQCIHALQNDDWAMENKVAERTNLFVDSFFRALGEVTYSVSAIVAMINARAAEADDDQTMDENSFLQQSIPEDAEDDVEKILAQAELNVCDGMVTYRGNALTLACNLQHAWVESVNSSMDVAVEYLRSRLPRQTKQETALAQINEPLSNVRKQETVDLLNKYSDRMDNILREAIRAAHAGEEITPDTFGENLFIVEGMGWDNRKKRYTNDKPLRIRKYVRDDEQDPYSWLNLHTATKYLLMGGRRMLPKQEGHDDIIYATDQDAFFNFFHIKYTYRPATKDYPRCLDCKLAVSLDKMLKVRNNITAHNKGVTLDSVELQTLVAWLGALKGLLSPLSDVSWRIQRECSDLLEDLEEDFYQTLGPVTYRIPGIMEWKNIPPSEYDTVVALLTGAGMTITDRKVAISGNFADFAGSLVKAIRISGNSMEAGVRYFLRKLSGGTEEVEEKTIDYPSLQIDALQNLADGGDLQAQVELGLRYQNGTGGMEEDYALAVRWFEKAANNGSADAQFYLGECYDYGRSVERSYEQGTVWYDKAAQQGHNMAIMTMARNYFNGVGVQQDLKKAVEMFRKAAEQNNSAALEMLSACYWYGEGVEADIREAIRLAFLAAENGSAISLFNYGMRFYEGNGIPQNYPKAFECLLYAAEAGIMGAQFYAAQCYENGTGTEVDLFEALTWYQKAAGQRHKEGMYALARCYKEGIGIEPNSDKAIYWYQILAEQGERQAQFELAKCYERRSQPVSFGDGIRRLPNPCQAQADGEQAVYWYRQAALQGSTDAMRALANCYVRGIGTEADMEKSVQWVRAAAECGDVVSIYEMGYSYEFGEGVETDYAQAAAWYQKAADKEHAGAMYGLGQCYEKGRGVEADAWMAMIWYMKSALLGYSLALLRIADRYYEGGVSTQNPPKLDQHGAEVADDGMPVKPDRERAISLYKRAAKAGSPEAWRRLYALGIK